MSIEQGRSFSGGSPQVTTRVCATIVFFVGVICVFGGYLLGRMSRGDVKRTNDVIIYNLTSAADSICKKAKRISPKALNHIDLPKLTLKFHDIFHCTKNECGEIKPLNLPLFVRNCINTEVTKLIRSIQNATVYIDSLR